MPTLKSVQVRTHGPLSILHENHDVPWEDVYLRFHDGRETVQIAPMIESRSSLVQHIEIMAKVRAEMKIKKKIFPGAIMPLLLDEIPTDVEDQECAMLTRLDQLKMGERFVSDETPRVGKDWQWPNIYTSAERLDRAEVERACAWYIGQMGYKYLSFRWKPLRGLCIRPFA